MTTLVLLLKKIESEDKTKYDTFYSNSKTEIIINEYDIDDAFESIYTTVISSIQKYLGKGADWIIDWVIDHNISISKYNPLTGGSYVKLLKDNIDDNKCFKWSLLRYLNPADHNPRRTTKADKDFAKRLDFKGMKLTVKIRDIHKLQKKNCIDMSAFGYMK